MTMQPFDNPLIDFLSDPDVGFRADFFSRPGARGTPTRSRFFEDQFQTVQNQFLGQLGAQIRSGEAPTLTGTQFLDAFNFDDFFAGQPPAFRGSFPSRFNPRARHLFFS